MTYGQFLVLFLLAPIAVLALLLLRDRRLGARGHQWRGLAPWGVLAGLIVVAMAYTIPWDDHLIAEGVWWYAPSRVNGAALDRIPLEEVLFFPLQTILVGLWVIWLGPRLATVGLAAKNGHQTLETDAHGVALVARWHALVACGVAWLAALVLLLRGWQPGTYLGWELVWALPPLIVQFGLGGDLLWRRGRLFLAALAPTVLYLSLADILAIHEGIWTIAPDRSLGLLFGGVLPLEEFVFFLLTSALVSAGLILGVSDELKRRLRLSA